MENCSVRKTRQIMEEQWLSRCYDENIPILIETIILRKRKAELLGYKSYSDLKLNISSLKSNSTGSVET
jgi:Zn-dependent oligopeptidase